MEFFDLLMILRELTKPRIRKKEFASSNLRRLTMKTIVSEANFYWTLGDITNSNPYEGLPDTLKTELLIAFLNKQGVVQTEEPGIVCTLQWLLNSTVTNFSFPNYHFRESKYSDLWRKLTLQCPNLQIVKWNLYSSNKNFAHRANFFSSLGQFKELQVIRMHDYICDDLDLCRLAANLPELRCLKIRLADNVSSVGFDGLSKLRNFRELDFEGLLARGSPEKIELFFFLGMKFLPHLYSIGFGHQNALTNYTFKTRKYTMSALEKFQELGTEELTLELKTLSLSGIANPPHFLRLPNLEILYLVEPSNDFYPDERLLKVKELSSQDAEMSACELILKGIGQHLQKLWISVSGTLVLDVVFRECPNLEELIIDQCEHEISLISTSQTDCMKNLKRLSIFAKHPEDNHFTVNFQPGLLLKLLQFPELRKVQIGYANLSQEESTYILRDVIENRILQKVERFSFQISSEIHVHDGFQEYYVEYKQRVQSILINVAIHCPNLTEAF